MGLHVWEILLFRLVVQNKLWIALGKSRRFPQNSGRTIMVRPFLQYKGEQKSTISISSRNLTEPLRTVMKNEWEAGKRYRVRGFWVPEAKTMCFDLTEAVQEDYRRTDAEGDAGT